MDIHVPKRLTYLETQQVIGQQCQQSLLSGDPEFNVDWTRVEWADLPEIIFILNWSSKLIQHGKSVTWMLEHPLGSTLHIDELRVQARLALGEDYYRRVSDQMRRIRRKLEQGQLYPKTRREVLSRIRKESESKGSAVASAINPWLEAEESSMLRADMLAYLSRYDVFTQAYQAGITVIPDPRQLPKSPLTRKPDTPSLELRSIHSLSDVDVLVDRMSSTEELARVLGDYASLDVVRRGALARIIVTELGKNVGEHSECSAAWVCTRLVTGDHAGMQTEGDPATESFRKRREGFLEVLVCDNGVGLANGLEEVLRKDKRESVRIRYQLADRETPKEWDLVDYAFDRLASTKRNIVELVHLLKRPGIEAGLVASGLYWVWNVARSHYGVLSVRTGTTHGWYDFTVSTDESRTGFRERTLLQLDRSSVPCCGTMIRICLPLAETHSGARTMVRRQVQPREPYRTSAGSDLPSPKAKIVWIGDLARSVESDYSRTLPKKMIGSQTYMFEDDYEDDYRIQLLRALQAEHFPLRDGDMLVLDLCGLQYRWAMASVNPLCHFVTEMNYTSTVGRSAVILWNVPTQEGELFERGMEDAMGTYSHLQGFRRASLLVWDDGRTRLFCGWPEAEAMLGTLRFERELRLDNMLPNTLGEDDREGIRKLVSENSHLLEWAGPDLVRIRPWPPQLSKESWQQAMHWFNQLLEKSVEDGGVLNSLDSGYYRLPSSGRLVRNFYQFDVMLSNQQACARIVWLLAQMIKAIELQGEMVEWIVSVTRPMMSLAQDIAENYRLYRHTQRPRLLARSTIEELERDGKEIASGSAILLTDVISSGHLCEQVQAVVPGVKWLGTLALLDTRDLARGEQVKQEPIEIYPGWDILKTHDSRLGDLYPLSRKGVEKLHPADVKTGHVIPIDKVNVCPALYPDLATTRKRDIWPFVGNSEQALSIGHYQAGDYHHYSYYINPLQLLDAVDPDGRQSLRDLLVQSVVDDLDGIGYNPDKTVLIHPPRETSCAEEIAREVQRHTGILHRLTLYRDSFAGHWRFSPFVQRGVRFKGFTAVLIDDGSNTGETLVALLDAATFGKPERILAYVGITRMPLHKADLFSRLTRVRRDDLAHRSTRVRGLSDEGQVEVKVQFMVSFNVPVYSPRTCPICRFGRGLSEVSTVSPLFAHFADVMRGKINATKVGHGEAEECPSLWKYATPLSVARLREEIELIDYPERSAPIVDEILAGLVASTANAEDDDDSLLNLGFVLCVEPELARSAKFAPYVTDLLRSALRRIERCHEDNLMTYTGLAYELMLVLHAGRGTAGLQEHSSEFWRSVFGRSRLTVVELAEAMTYMLARAFAERGVENEPSAATCNTLAEQLLEHVSPRTAKQVEREYSLVEASGRVFAREMISTLRGSGRITGLTVELNHTDLLTMAATVAGRFWRHASEHVNSSINDLAGMPGHGNGPTQKRIRAAVGELLQGFYELHQLQHSLSEIERSWGRSRRQRLGVGVRWGHADMDTDIDEYGRSLIQIVEAVEASTDIAEKVVHLRTAWRSLSACLVPAFDDIFPLVSAVFDNRWNEWESVTQLPTIVAKPLDSSLGSGDDRVFVPRVLLARFFSCAMENLRTAAFRGWRQMQLESEAYARVNVTSSEDAEGQPILCIRVLDNGRLHREGVNDPSSSMEGAGSGLGLRDTAEMVKPFGGSLIGPCVCEDETVVELRLRRVVLARREHV